MQQTIRICLLIVLPLLIVHTACNKAGTASSSAAAAGGSLARFALVGQYLYLVGNDNFLTVYDIANPREPQRKSAQIIGFGIETIFPFKDKLFIGSSQGMYIYSLADPAKPASEGAIGHFRSCDPVVANDSVSYVTLRGGTLCGGDKNVLMVYDIRVAGKPAQVAEITMSAPRGLGLGRNALYVCEGDRGLTVFDLADPWHPARRQTLSDATYYDVIPYGDVLIAWTGAGVSFFDISNPLQMVKAGELIN